jgi:aspartate aminotransferase-like enzyme
VLERFAKTGVADHMQKDVLRGMLEAKEMLRELWGTKNVYTYGVAGTGFSGLDCVLSLILPGDKVVAFPNGTFSGIDSLTIRMKASTAEELAANSLNPKPKSVVVIDAPHGQSVSGETVDKALAQHKPMWAFMAHWETGSGRINDLKGFSDACLKHGVMGIVDAVSSLGAVPLESDLWGIDVVVSGSQKALMSPPGLMTVSVSDEAWKAREGAAAPRFYLDWERTRVAQESLDAAFTPAVSIVMGLNVALGMILERGLDAAFDEHVRLGRACREGVKAMGLELFSPDDDSSAVVTTVRVPESINGSQLLLDLRDRFGITLAPGQGPLKGKVFRVGHLGYYDVFDITTALAGIELTLAEAGADIERGVAVTRALETYEHQPA